MCEFQSSGETSDDVKTNRSLIDVKKELDFGLSNDAHDRGKAWNENLDRRFASNVFVEASSLDISKLVQAPPLITIHS